MLKTAEEWEKPLTRPSADGHPLPSERAKVLPVAPHARGLFPLPRGETLGEGRRGGPHVLRDVGVRGLLPVTAPLKGQHHKAPVFSERYFLQICETQLCRFESDSSSHHKLPINQAWSSYP
jgi:hypothetical protein